MTITNRAGVYADKGFRVDLWGREKGRNPVTQTERALRVTWEGRQDPTMKWGQLRRVWAERLSSACQMLVMGGANGKQESATWVNTGCPLVTRTREALVGGEGPAHPTGFEGEKKVLKQGQ